jgi:hypothetical protein
MNTIKLLMPLLIAYSINAADSEDTKKAVETLKEKGKTSFFNEEKTYILNTNPTNYSPDQSSLRYHEFFNGKEALSYEYEESFNDTIRTTAIYDYLRGKVDGTPDICVITEMTKNQRRKMSLDRSYVPTIFTTVGKIDSTQNARYNEAIEEIIARKQ